MSRGGLLAQTEDDWIEVLRTFERGDDVPRRAPYSAFVEAGCVLDRPAGERPWRARVYARDTSVVYNELAMPVYVGARRHSTVRFIYDADVV